MNKISLFALMLLLILLPAYAQTEQDAVSIRNQTMSADIETSTYNELTAWCIRLGLPSDGSADELRRRLYSYYKTDPQKQEEGENGLRKITIEKAENLDYFTIEKIDQNYAEITGNVFLTIEDTDKNEKHIIQADRILFNFKENFITASGNITYRLEGETKTENFRGEKITFNIDDTEGLFDKGVTEQKKNKDSEDSEDSQEITFYFKGDLINKTKENYVILENGEITSCDLEQPHFKINAQKIWLLADNEWAILNGTLFLGRVPMLYFPAFIYAGDEMFFNPVFGYNSEYGNYIQTTTYFIGEKTRDEDSPFSIMQSENGDKYYKTSGLFLTEEKSPDKFSKAVQDYGREQDNYIKLMVDYYSYLGFYTALDMKLNPPSKSTAENFPEIISSILTVLEKNELYLSLAFARKYETVTYPVYTTDPDNPSGTYTHVATMFPDENGIFGTVWKKSFFLDHEFPFRYGIDYSTSVNFDWLKINADFNLFSDADYKTDYLGRNENLDLLSMLKQEDTTENDSVQISTYKWAADASLNPDVKIFNPFLKTLTLTANTQLTWNSEEIDHDLEGFEDTVDWYFYPDNFNLPKVSASIKGSFLPVQADKKQKEAESTDSEIAQMRPPWEDSEKEEVTIPEYNLPEAEPDLSIKIADLWSESKIFSNSLNYTISPEFNEYTSLDSDQWETPLEIDFSDIAYSYRTAALDGSLDYKASFFDSFLSFSEILKFGLDYQQHYNMDSLSEDTVENYLVEDKHKTNVNINNNLTINSSPLIFLDYVDKTKISYNFNTSIYEYDYDDDTGEFTELFFEPTEDYITAHKISLEVPFKTWNLEQTVSVSTSLPPLSMATKGSWLFKYGISSSELNTEVTETDDEYEYSPLTYNQSFVFNSGNSISNSLSYNYSDRYFEKNIFTLNASLLDGGITAYSKLIYDFENTVFDEFSLNLNIFDFYTKFSAENAYDYKFIQDTGWQQSSEQSFLPDSLKTGIDTSIDELRLWKNRIIFDFSLDTSLDMRLIQFTESAFIFNLAFDIDIYEFLQLHFEAESENKSVYRYFPGYCAEVGVNTINPVEDLLKSFNFFDIDDRYTSNFNLKKIVIGLEHDLHDWTLNIDYTGKYYLNTDEDTPYYDWDNQLDIYLRWNAISDIKTEIEIDKQDISF